MKVSSVGASLIAQFEGGQGKDGLFHPYRDAVGVWTIGFGHTHGVGPGSRPLTRAQALSLLRQDLDVEYGRAVNALKLPLNQYQFDALVSFVYNVGPGGVSSSTTVGKRLRAHDWRGAADGLLAWNRAGGRVLPGLTIRRQAERALFLKPVAKLGPASWLTKDELAMVREFDRRRKAGTLKTVAGRALVMRMLLQRKRIWHVAENDPRGRKHGWAVLHRAERYRSLKARTA